MGSYRSQNFFTTYFLCMKPRLLWRIFGDYSLIIGQDQFCCCWFKFDIKNVYWFDLLCYLMFLCWFSSISCLWFPLCKKKWDIKTGNRAGLKQPSIFVVPSTGYKSMQLFLELGEMTFVDDTHCHQSFLSSPWVKANSFPWNLWNHPGLMLQDDVALLHMGITETRQLVAAEKTLPATLKCAKGTKK